MVDPEKELGRVTCLVFYIHSLKQSWKWTVAPWKTIFLYQEGVVHFHDCCTEGNQESGCPCRRTSTEGVGCPVVTSTLQRLDPLKTPETLRGKGGAHDGLTVKEPLVGNESGKEPPNRDSFETIPSFPTSRISQVMIRGSDHS